GGRLRRLENWANNNIAPSIQQLESKIKTLEEQMATPAELQHSLDQTTNKLSELHLLLQQFIPAVEGQTSKYLAVVQERDALLAEKAEREAQLEKAKTDLEKANATLTALHEATATAVKNLAA